MIDYINMLDNERRAILAHLSSDESWFSKRLAEGQMTEWPLYDGVRRIHVVFWSTLIREGLVCC